MAEDKATIKARNNITAPTYESDLLCEVIALLQQIEINTRK